MLLHDILKDRRLILASASPRRRQLLADADLQFEIAPPYDVDESYPGIMVAKEVPAYLARIKSMAYPGELAAGDILITADTVVILDGEVIGKPEGRDGAIKMLDRLSGQRHEVVTAVMLRSAAKEEIFSTQSSVWFRSLAAEDIIYYVDRYEPYDKAGSYGIQEWLGCVAIERIEGSFYNVMGLPVQMLYSRLKDFVK